MTVISVKSSENFEISENRTNWVEDAAVMELRAKLEGLAELRDWSLRRVAKNAGLAQQTLASAMNGHSLRVEYAIAVARVMDVPVEWLFDDKKGWKDLKHRPFWLPPGVDPGGKVSAIRHAESEADRLVAEKHGIEAGSKLKQRSTLAGAARKAIKARAHRKFHGEERSTGT